MSLGLAPKFKFLISFIHVASLLLSLPSFPVSLFKYRRILLREILLLLCGRLTQLMCTFLLCRPWNASHISFPVLSLWSWSILCSTILSRLRTTLTLRWVNLLCSCPLFPSGKRFPFFFLYGAGILSPFQVPGTRWKRLTSAISTIFIPRPPPSVLAPPPRVLPPLRAPSLALARQPPFQQRRMSFFHRTKNSNF
jgi:hypothetical protein